MNHPIMFLDQDNKGKLVPDILVLQSFELVMQDSHSSLYSTAVMAENDHTQKNHSK